MATWSTKYPLNISPLGTNRQEGFEKHVLEFTEVYNYLNLVRKAQAGTVAPTAPETNDLWLDTSGTTPILKYWSDSIWATISSPSITNRNTVLQGHIDEFGNGKLFEAGTGLAVKLNATSREAIFTFMNGNSASQGAVDLIASVSADSAAFWSSLPTNSTVYLYVDYNSGTPSGGFTTVAPVYQNYAPSHASGKHWFDFNTGKVWSSDGSAWTQRNRIIVGTATTDGTGVTAVNVYPYNDYKGSASNYLPTSYLDTDGTLAANSDSKIATQKAVKAYVDSLPTPSGGASIGTGNYIAEPFSVVPGTGLEVLVNPNRCVIDETVCESTTATTVALTANYAQLIYKKKDNTYDKLLAEFDAIDASTILRWVGTAWNGAAVIPTSVGTNDLTKNGTVAKSSGIIGYAATGNGTNGFLKAANTTNIPAYADAVSVHHAFGFISNGAAQCFFDDGVVEIACTAANNLRIGGVDTLYTLTHFTDYEVSVTGAGGTTTGNVYVNGALVYTGAVITNTAVVAPNIGSNNTPGEYSVSTWYGTMIDSVVRTHAQIATMAKKLLIPCSGEYLNASYPVISVSDLATDYHEWKFDETSGTTATDSAGTLNGTYVGTITKKDSTLGIGNCVATPGTTGSYIDCGSYALPPSFTMIFVGQITNSSTALFGNRAGSCAFMLTATGGQLTIAGNVSSGVSVDYNAVGFYAISVTPSSTTFYSNSPTPIPKAALSINYTSAGSLTIGVDKPNPGSVNPKIMEYAAIIPRALSPEEMSAYYTAMIRVSRSDIRSVLPADSIVTSYVETSSTAPTKIIDSSNPSGATPDWAYGIRVGPRGLDNRRKFLGWQVVAPNASRSWINPFDSRKIRTQFVWAQDAFGTNESETPQDIGSPGIIPGYENSTSNRISAYIGGNIVRWNGAWTAGGYIGCYAEVID